jgi:hypothetical protein
LRQLVSLGISNFAFAALLIIIVSEVHDSISKAITNLFSLDLTTLAVVVAVSIVVTVSLFGPETEVTTVGLASWIHQRGYLTILIFLPRSTFLESFHHLYHLMVAKTLHLLASQLRIIFERGYMWGHSWQMETR